MKRGSKARVNLAVIFGRPWSSTLNLIYWLTPHHTLIDPHIMSSFWIPWFFFSSFILFVSVYCSSDLWDCSIALERSKSFCYFKLYFSTVLISLGFGFSVDPLLKNTSPFIEWTRFSLLEWLPSSFGLSCGIFILSYDFSMTIMPYPPRHMIKTS